MQYEEQRTIGEQGFTLIEVMIALSIIMVILYVGLNLAHQMSASFLSITTRHSAVGSVDALEARLRDDAKSAWEVTAVPCPGGTDSKIDFYTQDNAGGHFWSYRFVYSTKSLYLVRNQAYTDACALSSAALTTQGLLMIDGLTSFSVETTPTTTALTNGSSPYINSTGIAARIAAIPLGNGIPVSNDPGVAAGNATLTNIQVANSFAARSIDLLPGIMPSGYTEALTYKPGARTLCGIGDQELAAKCHQGLNLSSCNANFGQPAAIFISASPSLYLYVGAVVFTFSGTDSMNVTDPFAIIASESTWNSSTMGSSNAAWIASFSKLAVDMNTCMSLSSNAGLYNNGTVGATPSTPAPLGNYSSQAPTQFCARPYNAGSYVQFNQVCTSLITSAVAGGSDGTSLACSISAPVYAGIALPGYVPITATTQEVANTQLTVSDLNSLPRNVSGCPAVQSGV